MTLDRERLLAYLTELTAALEDWERYRARATRDLLVRDRDARNMVLHAMLIAIQAAIDIGQHLLAANRWERPGSYRETFELLAAHGALSAEPGDRLARLAGFRNALVHVYWKLDLDMASHGFTRGRLKEICHVTHRLEGARGYRPARPPRRSLH
jgi:uncharacterized protein YutE (UPF0331/DUF86 family)